MVQTSKCTVSMEIRLNSSKITSNIAFSYNLFSVSRIINMVTRQGASWANSLGSVGKTIHQN